MGKCEYYQVFTMFINCGRFRQAYVGAGSCRVLFTLEVHFSMNELAMLVLLSLPVEILKTTMITADSDK